MPPPTLSADNRQLLQSWLMEFRRTWNEGSLDVWVRRLPTPDTPLRLAVAATIAFPAAGDGATAAIAAARYLKDGNWPSRKDEG